MSYLSFSFLGLTALLVLIYYLIPEKLNSKRWIILLLGSLIFYAFFDLRYLLFLLFAVLSTYFCGLWITRTSRKKLVFISCIVANVGVWYTVKALPWTLRMIQAVIPGLEFHSFSIISAVGISYFTLQAIGYLVDVYKAKTQPEKCLGKYLLFITYFPAIVQGPISRYDALMPQLLNTKKFSFETMRESLVLVLFGLIKKMVIADRLGIFVNTCFEQYNQLNGFILLIAAVGYAVQLYTDFSGCVDICRGVSQLFNVKLINNFNRPYLSGSIKEFWGKWHISLSSWLKDYVYIPLGGNRKGTYRKYLNLMITFLVSGLWHGAGLSFFVWGALHAGYQIVGQCTTGIRDKAKSLMGINKGSASDKIYQTLITFALVTFAWIFFRANNLTQAIEYICRIFTTANPHVLFDGSLYAFGVDRSYFTLILIHIVLLFVVELCTQSQESAINGIFKQHLIIRWLIYWIAIFDIILFGVYGSGYDLSSFMYGGF